MLNFDEPSRIFPCILLTRNHMIFLVQFGINKHLLIFSKTTNCTRPTGSCNFGSLSKNLLVFIYSKLLSKSCDYLYEFLTLLTVKWNQREFQTLEILASEQCLGWVGKTELGCFKAECCNICIVSFSRTLKIVSVNFQYTLFRGIELYASVLVRLLLILFLCF